MSSGSSCIFTAHSFILFQDSFNASLGLILMTVRSPRNWSWLITDSTKRNAVRKVFPAAQGPVIGTGVKTWTCILSLQDWEPTLPETKMWSNSIPVYVCGSFLGWIIMVVHLFGCYVLFWYVLVLVTVHSVLVRNNSLVVIGGIY